MAVIFTSNGVRTLDSTRVRHVHRTAMPGGRYCQVVLLMDNGEEASGLMLVAALDRLEATLADAEPPPAAA